MFNYQTAAGVSSYTATGLATGRIGPGAQMQRGTQFPHRTGPQGYGCGPAPRREHRGETGFQFRAEITNVMNWVSLATRPPETSRRALRHHHLSQPAPNASSIGRAVDVLPILWGDGIVHVAAPN